MEHESGSNAQLSNIIPAKTVVDVIRTCLGPLSMLKTLLDPLGGVLLTNDGNRFLCEIEVYHPAKKADWNRIPQIEEQLMAMCDKIITLQSDLVFTQKDVSDLAQHYSVKANITAILRVRKTDNNCIVRALGATIVNRVDDLRESDVGTKCSLFNIGDEYFTFLTKCEDPKAYSIVLRGPSKDIINEVEHNLQDAMSCVLQCQVSSWW